MSLCFVSALLTPKKDDSQRMYIYSRVIGKIVVNYMFFVHRFEDMLDLHNEYYQIRIRVGAKWKFKTKNGLYRELIMCFRLQNNPNYLYKGDESSPKTLYREIPCGLFSCILIQNNTR